MAATVCHLPVAGLRDFTAAVLARHGLNPADAETCAKVLLMADRFGVDSHGISRLKYYCDRLQAGITRATTHGEIVRETTTTAVIDAHLSMGHVVAVQAMELAVEKAASHGLGAVAVRNSTHFGIAGYYSRMASDAGMIGMTFTNARPAVAPTFSVQPLFGTNPIAVAAPSDEAFPFWFDAATSISQRGKVEVKARSGEPLPSGVAVNEVGEPITDAALLLRKLSDGTGALLPLGGAGEALSGYKGYALATVGEIFCAALQQGAFLSALAGGVEGGIAKETRLGHFFLAMQVEAFVPLPAFRKAVGDMMRELRAARKAPGVDRIWTPGEKEYETMLARDRSGIPVNQELLAELCELRQRLGLDPRIFPLGQG